MIGRKNITCFYLITILSYLLLILISIASSTNDLFHTWPKDVPDPIGQLFFNELVFRDSPKSTYDMPLIEAAFDWIKPEDERKGHIKLLLDHEVADIGAPIGALRAIERAGYSYEIYNTTSKDGYITQLIRIVNRSVKRKGPNYPPVAIYGGQSISPALFAQASITLKYHNRSIAFELANLGFDVWMVPARGVDSANRDWFSESRERFETENKTLADELRRLVWSVEFHSYWSFCQDEIIEFEFQIQLDRILQVTGCEALSLITYSNGGLISFGFLASHPEYTERIESLIAISPAIFVNNLNPLLRMSAVYGQVKSPGEALVDEFWDASARHQWINLCKNKVIRYTACKFFLDSFYGSSTTFNTFIALNMLEYISRPQPVRGLVQLMQIANSGVFRRFSHGLLGDMLIYGTPFAPEYKLGQMKHDRLYIFSGTNDDIANLSGTKKLIDQLGKKPVEHYEVSGYNHLDMITGWDVDEAVVSPVVNILLKRDFELTDPE